jgi:hypothetical protein
MKLNKTAGVIYRETLILYALQHLSTSLCHPPQVSSSSSQSLPPELCTPPSEGTTREPVD